MEHLGTGAGLAALGFWAFIACMAAVSVWANIRRRDAEHETLRRIVESGQTIDDGMIDRLLGGTNDNRELDRDLKVSALLVWAIAPGILLLGWGLETLEAGLFAVMLGIAGLLVCIGVGLYAASVFVNRRTIRIDS